MHNWPVAVRIIGGYIVVVVLAAVIAAVGFMGITSMSASFNQISEHTMPMIDDSNLLVTHTLLAQHSLNAFEKSNDASQFNSLEEAFNKLVDKNQQIAKSLANLLKDSPDLTNIFKDTIQAQNVFVTSGRNLMARHREAITKSLMVDQQVRKFGDMGDETLSFLYDMEGAASLESSVKGLSKLENEIENISGIVNDAIRSGIKMAVLEARSNLNESFDDIETSTNKLAASEDLKGQSGFVGMRAAYNLQKAASEKLLTAYMEKLDAQKLVAESFAEVETSTSQTVDVLAKLVEGIDKLTDETKKQSQSVIDTSRSTLIIFALIALVASIVVAILITRSIRGPLGETVTIIKTIATGDLSHKFEVNRRDELGQLMLSMQELVHQLRNMLSEINSNSEQLASTAEESSSICQMAFKNINQQKSQTDQMVTAVHEMTATVNEVSNSASLTLSEVESAHHEVQNGEEVLGRNVERFQNLAQDIRNAAEVIQKLNDDCKNIGGVLDVIKGVAEQTNLLALNAAIEAARAGEQGRGFAVVADEVRTLASRAHDSTAEIEDMIARLQSRANEAVNVMDKSQKEASQSVESISEATGALRLVSNAINTIKDMSYQIASAAEQQAAASQSQLESITAIADIAEDTANGAQENQVASQELAKMAEIQRGLVGRFKL